MLLEAVVCHRGSEKADALIAGEPVCEGILVAVYIVAAFGRYLQCCGGHLWCHRCHNIWLLECRSNVSFTLSIYFLDSVLIFFYR